MAALSPPRPGYAHLLRQNARSSPDYLELCGLRRVLGARSNSRWHARPRTWQCHAAQHDSSSRWRSALAAATVRRPEPADAPAQCCCRCSRECGSGARRRRQHAPPTLQTILNATASSRAHHTSLSLSASGRSTMLERRQRSTVTAHTF
jgi:hypothetical protein